MIELHLIGYTADLGRLVLDLAGADGGRYRLVVDEDLFATVDELREERRAAGLPVGDLVEFADELGLDVAHLAQVEEDEARAAAAAGHVSAGSAAGTEALRTGLAGPEPEPNPDVVGAPAPSEPPAEDEAPADADEQVERGASPDDAPAGGWRPTPLPARGNPSWSSPADATASVRLLGGRPAAPPDAPGEPEPQPDARRWADEDADGLVARLLEERAATPAPEPSHAPEPSPDPEPEPPTSAPESSHAREPSPETVPEPSHAPEPAAEREVPAPLAVPPRRDGATRQPPRPLPDDTPRRPRTPARPSTEPEPEPAGRPAAALSPAEIQARLRMGRSVRAVAREAGVDEDRIRRWEAPILAEQARIRDAALGARLERSRLGTSTLPLGDAVARNLASRGIDVEDATWDVARRRDGRWRVAVRWTSRGRKRSATWTWDADDGVLSAASDSARELGFTRARR